MKNLYRALVLVAGVLMASPMITCEGTTGLEVIEPEPPGIVLPSEPERAFGCAADSECSLCSICIDGVCVVDASCCVADTTCVGGEVCNPATHRCVDCIADTNCNDGNICTKDTCRIADNVCKNEAIPLCCKSNIDCRDDDACTLDVCNTLNGKCSNNPSTDPSCCNVSFDCDDANPCTADACEANVCKNSLLDGVTCDDQDLCNGQDFCRQGVCAHENPVVCTPLDQCHVAGICDVVTGLCSNPKQPDATPCSDGRECTGVDTCQEGVCVPAPASNICQCNSDLDCAPPDQCHLTGTCNFARGACSYEMLPDGVPCNDDDACTRTDSCLAGVCTGSMPVACLPLDQCHMAGACDTVTGLCSDPPLQDGTLCNDNDLCTTPDACVAGACKGTVAVTCVAADQCHDRGVCDPTTGVCSDPKKPDGTECSDRRTCTGPDTCQAGVCVPASNECACDSDEECVALDQCHLRGTCDVVEGLCSNPIKPDGAACNDADACTQSDSCMAGVCTGIDPVVCTPLDQCHDAGMCDSATGVCSNPAKPENTPCNDASHCTYPDTCREGVCVGSVFVICEALDQCHVAGVCDPATGVCNDPFAQNGTPCDDERSCTGPDACQNGICMPAGDNCDCDREAECISPPNECHEGQGSCDVASGRCTYYPKADGTDCNDGNECTMIDECSGGYCAGSVPPDCNDGNVCTDESCDPMLGCVYTANTVPCDDYNACTGTDVVPDRCADRACVSGDTVNCDDGTMCTSDACNPMTGCVHIEVVCDDQSVCTDDSCDSATGCKNEPLSCDDSNACTTDKCDAIFGCYQEPVVCFDDNLCTYDLCDPQIGCQYPLINCDDGNVCTTDTCDPFSGCRYEFNTASCDDQEKCTVSDVCTNGNCVGTLVVCDPPDQCHYTGVCNSASGLCDYQSKPEGTACDDMNPCTSGDQCMGGTCMGTLIPGCKTCTADGDCEDMNLCTYDACTNGVCDNAPATCGVEDGCCSVNCLDDPDCPCATRTCGAVDGCCPSGCTWTQDADCPKVCTGAVCGTHDGCCPVGCSAAQDVDCSPCEGKVKGGKLVVGDKQCESLPAPVLPCCWDDTTCSSPEQHCCLIAGSKCVGTNTGANSCCPGLACDNKLNRCR